VKFKWRASAQFAMEALHNRPLRPDGSQPLRLSWPTTDPSAVQAQQGRQMALASMEEARRRRESTHELYTRLEAEGLQLKRQRLSSSSSAHPMATAPSVSSQTPAHEAVTATAAATAWADSPDVPITAYTAVYPGADCEHTEGHGSVAGGGASQGDQEGHGVGEQLVDGLPGGWQAACDPTSGVTYFYHEATSRTQWERPEQ
jgi:hypothetical protein